MVGDWDLHVFIGSLTMPEATEVQAALGWF
jgi:hypothetical protein